MGNYLTPSVPIRVIRRMYTEFLTKCALYVYMRSVVVRELDFFYGGVSGLLTGPPPDSDVYDLTGPLPLTSW